MKLDSLDQQYMLLAAEESAKGFAAPNPHVGCVIVLDGQIVGKGHHQKAGGAHAEINALNMAGSKAVGATAYVTLEPCNHTGRTPPCTNALFEAGIQRVVIGAKDPNAKASGGAQFLRTKGVEVLEGVCVHECELQNYKWAEAYKLGRPFVTVKFAMTIDGFVSAESGKQAQITSEDSRKHAHRFRSQNSAILTGRRSIEIDNSLLTVRNIEGAPNPVRIVLDPSGKLNSTFSVFNDNARTIRMVGPKPENRLDCDLELQVNEQGKFEIDAVLGELWKLGLTSLIVEGGPETAMAFARSGNIDEVHVYVAKKVFGHGVRSNFKEFSRDLNLVEQEKFQINEEDTFTRFTRKS